MAKSVCKLLGVVLLLVGLLGFTHLLDPLGAHVGPEHATHNLVHIVSGILALYFGFAGSLSGARGFCLAFGAIYLLLGIAGLAMGTRQQADAGTAEARDDAVGELARIVDRAALGQDRRLEDVEIADEIGAVEQRAADEVRCIGSVQTAPANFSTYKPAFDVTPAALVSAIITDACIHRAPYNFVSEART